jgi:ATP-binding protein involved in chromosome partitioning
MRGPMIHNAINQLLQLTEWGDLDYLLVDLPPGTSDSPLTVMQTMTLDGFVVVTTPQDLANLDAKRSVNMIRKLKLDVLGVIENFSGGVFGSGGGANLADQLEVMFLGDISLRAEYQDISKPTVLTNDSIMNEYKVVLDKTKEALNLLKEK